MTSASTLEIKIREEVHGHAQDGATQQRHSTISERE